MGMLLPILYLYCNFLMMVPKALAEGKRLRLAMASQEGGTARLLHSIRRLHRFSQIKHESYRISCRISFLSALICACPVAPEDGTGVICGFSLCIFHVPSFEEVSYEGRQKIAELIERICRKEKINPRICGWVVDEIARDSWNFIGGSSTPSGSFHVCYLRGP